METQILNPTLLKNNLKIYSKTVLWISHEKLHIKYKGESKAYAIESIKSVFLTKQKSKIYQTFVIAITLFFMVSYFVAFNWFLLGLHIVSYAFSFLYLNQYQYYFVLNVYNNPIKYQIESKDKTIFKEFIKDFNNNKKSHRKAS